MNLIEETYRTPPGMRDYPFVYVFNPASLTDGQNYVDIQLPLQGDSDFILRHIAGVPTSVATAANGGRFRYKNSSRSYTDSAQYGMVYPNNFPVLPEKLYPINASIYLDLYNVLRASKSCGATTIYDSQLAFFGVKRYPQGQGWPVQVTPYRYREKRYSYEFQLTLNWGHYITDLVSAVEPTHRFSIPLDNFDFELCQISVSEVGAEGTLTTNDFRMTLYDPDMHQWSNQPVNQGFWNAGKPSPSQQGAYQPMWPVPSVVYPAGGNLVFDIQSMLCVAALPITYNISFLGMWRIPCG